jgi:2-octaprenyl-6-methoxyphenol hydroxylase
MAAAGIAVVGAGPVGLAAAALLADIGHDVTLIAPAAAPTDRRTFALMAGSVALLARLGVWSRLEPGASPLRTMRIVDGTRRLIRAPEVTFDASEIGLPAFGYNIANADLVAALDDAVAARNVRRIDALAEGVSTDDHGVTIRTSGGESITARLAVAADGRRSKLRDASGIVAQEWRYPQSALVCNLSHTVPHNDTSTEFHTEHGPFTLVPLSGNRSSLVWVDAPDATRRRLDTPAEELAAEIEVRSASLLGKITVDGPRQSFPLSGLSVRNFARHRIVLVGEAAHVFPPIGAQGLNLGYRDVAALGEVLTSATDDPGAPASLDAYERARRVDVMSRTAAVDALNRTLLSDFLPASVLRGVGLFLIDRIPPLRRLAMRQGVAAL